MNDLEAAWLAGIIDGEGCISINKSKPSRNNRFPRYRLILTVKMVHKPTIEKIYSITNVCPPKITKPSKKRPNVRIVWRWTCCDRTASTILQNTIHYMITKKNEAEKAIEFVAFKKSIKENMCRDEKGKVIQTDGNQLSVYETYKNLLVSLKKYEWKS